MKMTEDEAIAYLRHKIDGTDLPMEAIRTVCDALEAQRRAVPVDRESHIALREAYATNSEEDYFSARHSSLDMARNRHIFNAGFTRGFDTAVERYAAAPAQPATPSALGPITGVWIDEQPATETAGDARDAERWRWLRENGKEMTYDALLEIIEEYGDRADAKLDAAILAAQGVKS